MTPPSPVIALDVCSTSAADALLDRIGPDVEWVKVGLQLFTAEGPAAVRALRARGHRIFLDLKFHDIPNTVARAVEKAAALDVELLTVHTTGGAAMLRAARAVTDEIGEGAPRLLAVTVLTSLSAADLSAVSGRGAVRPDYEVARLARMAEAEGAHGVVASVHELPAVRASTSAGFLALAPGIRLAGDAAGDQTRVATPAMAARMGADFVVLGRSVTAAPDPRAALARAVAEMAPDSAETVGV